MRHASLTFDPAAAACDMPASLLIQRPRHATCQRYLRPSCLGMRHASVTFDPAAAACDMPALLSTQRPRHATCQGVRDASQVCQVPGQIRRRPQTPPASFPASAEAVRRRPEAEAVLIGISVRLHLVFASGFLSVCEGKGLYVRRACQYVILRISSPPCAWPECSFYRRPICCLSAPYASHGVLEIHEP